ncbi:hypothetical protein [Streptomyces cupreus]|uniref:CBM-cenC domain-containing protein n=1 Tax=Streptomyces cupreus TaxID=2759956 RepID=A0A7X1M9X1_9ACTN|nr:hypothetical protein [Streptomyces cupreus]MBC2903532.1 hypothetical protein [Streptomyces cupreus]
MVFPQTPLSVQIELQIGGVWTDITTDVYTAEKITIERGRPDEGQRTDPGKCAMVLNNRAGKYSPRNPLSPYYGAIGRNTPIRVSVLAGSQFLRLPGASTDYASTPDAAPLDITGDLDVRMDAQLVNWLDAADVLRTTELVGKLTLAAGGKSWFLGVRSNKLYLEWSADGTNTLSASSTTELVVPPSGRLAVRATLDVDNGASGRTVTFYTAPSGVAGPWTQLGAAVVQSGVTSIFNSSTALRVGNATDVSMTASAGRCMSVEIRNGINGTVVANPVFADQAIGTTSFADAAGRTWTLNGGTQITNRRTRFVGEVSSWPSRWDVSGKDVRVPIEAAGVLRRYGQGQKQFDSTLRRRIPAYSPAAYWPLEEAQGATQAYSPITGVQPMKVSGALTFASDDTLGGATTVPAWGDDAEGRGAIPAIPDGAWHLECVYRLDSMPSGLNTMFEVNTTGTAKKYSVRVQTNNVNVRALDGEGNELAFINITAPDFTGRWNRFQLWARQQGSDVEMHVAWLGVGTSGVAQSVTYTATEGRPSSVTVMGVPGNLRLGHVAVFSTVNTAAFAAADDGFAGETAGVRLRRLASEEAKPILVHGDTTTEELMGAQRPNTFLDLVEQAADVDGGLLYERRDILALAYRDRGTLYNQPPALQLDYNAPGLAHPLEPVDDDQAIRNDRTVQREGGSSARAVLETGPLSVQAPPNGVGPYDDSVTLNLFTDDQPASHAGWRLHLGTVDEARYPVVNVDLAANPGLIDAVTQLDSGDRLTIANPPAHQPPGPIDLIAQGYTEVIGHPIDWDLSFNCTPASPWNVAWVGSATTARDSREFNWVDGDYLTLAAALNSTDSVAPVITTTGPVWWGGVADTPYDWKISGEHVTVTAPGSLINANPFFNTDAASWSAQSCTIARSTAVVMPHPKARASLLITPNGSSAVGGALCAQTAVGSITPGGQYVVGMWVYSPGGWSDLRSAVNWHDSAGTFLSSSFGSGSVVPAGTWTYLEQTVTAPASASRAVVRAHHAGTPAATDIYYVWAVRITRPKASWCYDAFGRTAASGWGTSDAGLVWNTVGGGPATDYNVGSGYGSQTLSTVDLSRRTAITAIHPDPDIYCDMTTSALATGDSLYSAVTARMQDANNMYMLRIAFTTANTILVNIRKMIAGVQTQLGSTYTVPVTHVAGAFIRTRFQLQGTTLRAKAWPVTAPEPSAWHIETTDGDITAANQIGTRSIRVTGNTNTAAVEIRYDNLDVINPQHFTVARSANAIVKPQAVAAPVSLAQPAIVAL